MSDKNKITAYEQHAESHPVSEPQGDYLTQFAPNQTLNPVPLADILKRMGMSGPRIPAGELVDKPFLIMAAKPFKSVFDERKHAYFVYGVYPDAGEPFTTVLGGQAVVDIIDALASTGYDHPLEVTLRVHDGGRYGRYYVLE